MENAFLGRDDAPISQETWNLLDSTMSGVAKSILAGRRLLSIEGPYGLGLNGVPLADAESKGALTSSFVPLSFISQPFVLGKRDIAAFERDSLPLNVDPVVCAVTDCSVKEDAVIFSGPNGLLTAKGAGSLKLSGWKEVGTAADDIIKAVTGLDDAGFHGPYCLALAPALFNLLYRRYPQGDGTELDQVKTIVTDGVFKAPALKNGGVLLASGSQYASIVIGQDMSIGFTGPAGDCLEFSVSESLAALVKTPGAICVLK